MTWRDLALNAAVQAAPLAALAFLARSIVLHWLSKDVELFKTRLAAESQRAVESLRAELTRESIEHRVRFEALHASQVAAIEALYGKLVDTRYSLERFVHAWQPDNQVEFNRIRGIFFELRQELDKRRIHLPEELCLELDRCIQVLWRPTVAAGVWPGVNRGPDQMKAAEEFDTAMKAVLEGGSVEAAIKSVERVTSPRLE